MSLINVGICGASGKMGKALVRAVVNNNKLQLSSTLEQDSNINIGKDSGTIANIEPTGVNIISNADNFFADCAQYQWMARSYCNSMYNQLSQIFNNVSGVVFRTS